MGEVSITIPLVYIYMPIIFFISYYILKFVTIRIAYSYMKRRYRKKVEPVIYESIYYSLTNMKQLQSMNVNVKTTKMKVICDGLNESVKKVLPNRVKFEFAYDAWNDDSIKYSYISDIELYMSLVFPYGKTQVAYSPGSDISTDEGMIKEMHRENAIDNLLK